MAESVVTFFLRKLNDLLVYEAGLIVGAEKEIRSLQSQLEWIRSFLKDADGKSKENERVRIWVSQVRDVSNDAEDIIDAFIVQKQYQRQQQQQKTFLGLFRRFFQQVTQLTSLRRFSQQIKEINERIEEISANQSKYGLTDIQGGEASTSSTESQFQKPTVMDFAEEPDVVGIEDDVRLIVRRLATGEKRRAVISIVGMGGLGKTTIAKKVYNNVKGVFDFHAWISVSREYNVRVLMQRLMHATMAFHRDELERMDVEELRHKLAVYLQERRYLIVVDDLWNMAAWDAFVPAFPDGMKGSRVMLTTRNKDVALYADAQSVPYEPKLLPEEKCWELFCKKAFPGNAKVQLPPELERLGKEIVAKCGGLPLAVIVMGGMLSRKEKLPSEWEKVYKSISWQLREGQNRISGILDLSYNDLPYYLKLCFLYCGVFPEDTEFSTRKLINLWIAEGFIQRRGAETMEEVGEDYLRELIHRSMIQVAKKSSNGRVKTCRIHDLLRDLAISEAKEGKLYVIFAQDESLYSTVLRRLVVYHDSNELGLSNSNSHLRTLLKFTANGDLRPRYFNNLCNEARFLRVLDLEGVRLYHLPGQIGQLVHLRYLGFRKTGLNDLPGSIGNLFNLHTLDIRGTLCKSLPKGLLKNQVLRHLCMGRCSFQDFKVVCETINFPKHANLGRMRNLVTLTGIAAGVWITNSLEMLTNLRHLGIGLISSAHVESLGNSLLKLDHLHSLWLMGEEIPTVNLSQHHLLYKMFLIGPLDRLPNSWELPANLNKLYLGASGLKEDPFPILMGLRKLKNLGLLEGSYTGASIHCLKGGFLELEELVLQLTEVQEWKVDDGAMPRLKSMSIIECMQLRQLPDEMAYMRSLKKLVLFHMPDKFVIALQEAIGGSEFYKIEHIPSVNFI